MYVVAWPFEAVESNNAFINAQADELTELNLFEVNHTGAGSLDHTPVTTVPFSPTSLVNAALTRTAIGVSFFISTKSVKPDGASQPRNY